MLARITSKNQITIPKKIMELLPGVRQFDVQVRDGTILLKPVEVYETNLDKIREKMVKLGLTEGSVEEAVKWVRSR